MRAKTIFYWVFFSVTSVMLSACGGDKKANADADSSKVETVAKKDVVDDNALKAKLEIGEKLLKKHCSSCHQTEMYTRAESKIKSAEALLKQVKACDANIGAGLFDEDMEAITAHLAVNVYKFAK